MDRAFFARGAAAVARELLGCKLVHREVSGRIVETEAYYGADDPASHAFGGETERNQVMFGPAGQSYVYICYGIHCMLNVTTNEQGTPGAVLIRAVAPENDVDRMKDRRGVEDRQSLCDGPGKVCEAFDISKAQNDINLTQGELRIEHGQMPDDIVKTTRIGISEGEELELRFYDADSPHVSKR